MCVRVAYTWHAEMWLDPLLIHNKWTAPQSVSHIPLLVGRERWKKGGLNPSYGRLWCCLFALVLSVGVRERPRNDCSKQPYFTWLDEHIAHCYVRAAEQGARVKCFLNYLQKFCNHHCFMFITEITTWTVLSLSALLKNWTNMNFSLICILRWIIACNCCISWSFIRGCSFQARCWWAAGRTLMQRATRLAMYSWQLPWSPWKMRFPYCSTWTRREKQHDFC